MKMLNMAAFILTVVGSLNVGLVALSLPNVVESIFGGLGLSQIINMLIGASAVYVAATHTKEWMPSGK